MLRAECSCSSASEVAIFRSLNPIMITFGEFLAVLMGNFLHPLDHAEDLNPFDKLSMPAFFPTLHAFLESL